MSQDTNSKLETYKFQAEIQKVLDILINRLYKNREIFLRELISNAADACHRMRIASLEGKETNTEFDSELNIRITFNEDENTLTVSDNGIGMTREEIINNLGTIAQSGTLEFLKSMEKTSDAANLIGQFGVGFYSSFIVSDEVLVRTKSYKANSKGVEWISKGSGEFFVSDTAKSSRGTDVILHLKDDAKEFANKFKIETIVKKYSDFVGFPIRVGEDTEDIVNRRTPIWHQSATEVKDEEYNEFYHQVSMDWTEPFHRISLSVDAPIQFRALLFLPNQRNRLMMTSLYQDYGLKLYSKKILVQEKAKDLLPDYFRFVFGVVDSEDLPLNVSREVIQVDRTIRRISKVITSKLIDELEMLTENDQDKYDEWWGNFGIFIKEGITQDEKRREKLLRLLRVKTSKSEDEYITLKKYIEQMPEDQEDILYLLGENLQTLQKSPHLEYYKKLDKEVILFYEPIDSFIMMHVTEFQGKKFKAIDIAEPDLKQSKDEVTEDDTDDSDDKKEVDPFLVHIKEVLGDRVIEVRYTDLLTDSPCRLVNPSGMGAFNRMMKYMEENFVPQKRIIEFNPEHQIVAKLKQLVEEKPDSPLISLCVFQLLEGQELAEGMLQDPTEMISRNNDLIQKALQ